MEEVRYWRDTKKWKKMDIVKSLEVNVLVEMYLHFQPMTTPWALVSTYFPLIVPQTWPQLGVVYNPPITLQIINSRFVFSFYIMYIYWSVESTDQEGRGNPIWGGLKKIIVMDVETSSYWSMSAIHSQVNYAKSHNT